MGCSFRRRGATFHWTQLKICQGIPEETLLMPCKKLFYMLKIHSSHIPMTPTPESFWRALLTFIVPVVLAHYLLCTAISFQWKRKRVCLCRHGLRWCAMQHSSLRLPILRLRNSTSLLPSPKASPSPILPSLFHLTLPLSVNSRSTLLSTVS